MGRIGEGRGETIHAFGTVGDRADAHAGVERGEALQFGGTDDVEGQQQIVEAGIGHDFGLAQLLHRDADGAEFDLTAREAGQLVGLDVGAEAQSRRIGEGLRGRKIGLDLIEVDEDGGGIEFGNRGHLALSTSLTNRRLPEVRPASTGMVTPVIPEAASEARKRAALATSSGLTMRPRG